MYIRSYLPIFYVLHHKCSSIKLARWCALIGSRSKFNVSYASTEYTDIHITRALHCVYNNTIDAMFWLKNVNYMSMWRQTMRSICLQLHLQTQINRTFTYHTVYLLLEARNQAYLVVLYYAISNYYQLIVLLFGYKTMGAREITARSIITLRKLWLFYYSYICDREPSKIAYMTRNMVVCGVISIAAAMAPVCVHYWNSACIPTRIREAMYLFGAYLSF